MPRFQSLDELREHMRELQSRGDYQVMINTATEALAEFAGTSERTVEYGMIRLLRANAMLLSCDYPGAEVEYLACCAIFYELRLHVPLVQCQLRIARCAMWQMDLPRARELVEAALRELPADIELGLRAEAEEVLGRIALRQLDLPAAILHLDLAQQLYFEADKPYQALVTMNNLALAYIESKQFAQAGELLERCYMGLLQLGEYRRAWDAKISRAVLLTRQGQVTQARRILRDCLPDVERHPDFTSQYRLYYQLAILEILSGNQDESSRILHRLLQAPQSAGIPGAHGSLLLLTAVNQFAQDDTEVIQSSLAQAQHAFRQDDHSGESLLRALELVWLARTGAAAAAASQWTSGRIAAMLETEYQNAALLAFVLNQQLQLSRTWLELPGGTLRMFEHWLAELTALHCATT